MAAVAVRIMDRAGYTVDTVGMAYTVDMVGTVSMAVVHC